MKKIMFSIFRHGETDWTAERRFQGWTDVPLNKKGRQQASQLALTLAKLKPEVIYSSDLERARATAEIASRGLSLELKYSSDLREANLGEVEGMLRSEVIEVHGEMAWQKWISGAEADLDFSFPGGETKRAHLQRVKTFLGRLMEENDSVRHFGISSHGGVIARLVHSCEGAPSEPVMIKNCLVHQVEWAHGVWHYCGQVD